MVTVIGVVCLLTMLVLVPWSGRRWYERMKRGEMTRLEGYRRALRWEAGYALAAVVYALATGRAGEVLPLFAKVAPTVHAPDDILPSLLTGAVIGLVGSVAIPQVRRRIVANAKEVSALLPRTASERWTFVAVALSAGIAEELLWRGFLWHFVGARLPVVFPLQCLIVALVFGLGHLYQGVKGVLLTAMLGAGLLLLYLATGSLLAPIALHALIDLRAVLLAPSERLAAATAS